MINITKEIKKTQTSIASTTTIATTATAGSHALVTAFPVMPLLVPSGASRPLPGQVLRRLVAHDPLVVARSVVLTGAVPRAAVVFVKVVSERIFLVVCISLAINEFGNLLHAEIMTKLMGKEDRIACVIFSPLPHLCDQP